MGNLRGLVLGRRMSLIVSLILIAWLMDISFKVMPHLPKVFQSVQTYTLEYPHGPTERPQAVGMESCVGVEYVPFPNPLMLT